MKQISYRETESIVKSTRYYRNAVQLHKLTTGLMTEQLVIDTLGDEVTKIATPTEDQQLRIDIWTESHSYDIKTATSPHRVNIAEETIKLSQADRLIIIWPESDNTLIWTIIEHDELVAYANTTLPRQGSYNRYWSISRSTIDKMSLAIFRQHAYKDPVTDDIFYDPKLERMYNA